MIFILTSCSEKEKKSFCLEGCDCANSKTVPPGTWGDKMNTKYTYEKSSLTAQGFIQVYDSTSLTLVCIDGTNKIKSFKYERYQSGLNRTIISSIISYEDSSNVIYADTVISIPLGEFSCRRIVSTGVALKASVGNYAQTLCSDLFRYGILFYWGRWNN